MTEQHTCPRRAETGMNNPNSPFRGSGVNLDTWRDDSTCTYCGSLHPDKFMELVREGWSVGPTDKSYKAYLSQEGESGDSAQVLLPSPVKRAAR